MIAAHERREDLVRILIDAGANVKTRNKRRETASDIAGFVGDDRLVAMLGGASQK